MSKQNFFLTFAIVVLFSMTVLIMFGDKGLADLNILKKGRDGLAQKNEMMMQENVILYRSIERLKNDPGFIENVARQELGVIGQDELIIKIEKK